MVGAWTSRALKVLGGGGGVVPYVSCAGTFHSIALSLRKGSKIYLFFVCVLNHVQDTGFWRVSWFCWVGQLPYPNSCWVPTILAKNSDTLAECTASTIDQFFTWKQTFFGQNSTPPLHCCSKGKASRTVVQHCIGGKYWKGRELKEFHIKGKVSHTFWPGLYPPLVLGFGLGFSRSTPPNQIPVECLPFSELGFMV